MSAAERRQWLESTPAGMIAQAIGATGEVDHDLVDARVDEVRRHHARTYGRDLSEGELRNVRTVAELRSAVPAARGLPVRVPELVDQINSARPTAGWSYTPEFRGQASGMAVLQDGHWQGDPTVIERVQAAEAEKAARNAAETDVWQNGPAVMRTIARPT